MGGFVVAAVSVSFAVSPAVENGVPVQWIPAYAGSAISGKLRVNPCAGGDGSSELTYS